MYLETQAKEWATDVWSKAVQSWKGRRQDHNYRRHVARPGIQKILRQIPPIKHGVFLDVGCGDGSETRFLAGALANNGHTGTMFGYDPQAGLIDAARRGPQGPASIHLCFETGTIEELISKYQIDYKTNLVTSLFVLQNLPDLAEHIDQIMRFMHSLTVGVFMIVHPNFAEALHNKGALRMNAALKPKEGKKAQWRYAAEYPIVEKEGTTFFAPYFHRTFEDYRSLFASRFESVDFTELQPTDEVVRTSQFTKEAPFSDHNGNAYYPEINKIPSSLIIRVEKRKYLIHS